MSARALAPSPVARRLFELAERRADGTLDVGGRIVSLRRGAIAEVSGAEGDETLFEFMVRASRIDAVLAQEASRRAQSKRIPPEKALASVGVKANEIRAARRALYLDRLVRGLAVAEQPGATLGNFSPDATHVDSEAEEDLASLVLDALERRAGEHDAGLVGERSNELVHFVDGPFAELARKYVQQTDAKATPAVFEIFRRSPASASRIAALVRAGLVALQPEKHGAPPPKRPRSLAPAPLLARPSLAPATVGSEDGPRFRDTLRPVASPTREPVLRLEPGMAAIEPAPFPEPGVLPRLPDFVGPLADPLDATERVVAQLEQSQAPGSERATAWLAFAKAWLRHCASIDEAARCAREAAAADPENLAALRESTHLCAAMGRLDLARAYARATVHFAGDDEARSEGLLDLARLAERDGDVDAALASLEEATRLPEGSVEAWQRLAQLAYARGDVERALRAAVGASGATRDERPAVARAWAEWAQMLASSAEAAMAEAEAIERLGKPDVASAILAARARAPFDDPTRQRLLLGAAEIAERGGRFDLAFARTFEAHVTDPALDALYEPLVAYGERALPPPAYAALVEHLAVVAPDESRSYWLARAADAFERAIGPSGWSLELRTRAFLAEPSSEELREALQAHAERARDPSLYADALERLVRSGVSTDRALVTRRLLELSDHAEHVLGSAGRARWALERVHEDQPGLDVHGRLMKLRTRAGAIESRVNDARALVATAEADERPAARRALAEALAEDPTTAREAVDTFRMAVADHPEDEASAAALTRLLAVLGEHEELRLLHAARAEDDAIAGDRAARLRAWAGLGHLDGAADDAASAAEAWLAIESTNVEAAMRLYIGARMEGDPERRRTSLRHRLGTVDGDEARALLHVELALLERQSERVAETVQLADTARTLDPTCADALVVLLEELPRLEPRAALDFVLQARGVLGDTPQLLLVGADLAQSLGDSPSQKRLVDARCAIDQDAPAVAQLLVDRAIEEGDTNGLLAAAQAALARHAIVGGTPAVIERALAAIAQKDAGDAATVAIHAADRLGESRFAELALEYAERSGLTERKVAALERWVAWSSGSARGIHLRSLSAVHRDAGARASEARTWLRLLADEPGAEDAVERLSQLYAETRDAERLMAVLALRLESAKREQRRDRLLHLAVASVGALDDVERAEGFLRRVVSESDEPMAEVATMSAVLAAIAAPARAVVFLLDYAREAADEPAEQLILHAVHVAEVLAADSADAARVAATGLERFPGSAPLLVAFERAALDAKLIDEAKRVYAAVEEATYGVHGSRGVLYRRARFLERAGARDEAFDAYVEAFRVSPTEGAAFRSLSRLATELGRAPELASALQVLAESATHVDRRIALLREAASVAENLQRDVGAAFTLLFEGFRSTQRTDLLPDVRRLARSLSTKDARRADAALAEVVTALEARVEGAWDVDDQLRVLRMLAALDHDDLGNLERALGRIDRAIALHAEQPESDVNEATEAACDAAEWLLTLRDSRCHRYLDAARSLMPDHARAASLERIAVLDMPARSSVVPEPSSAFAAPATESPRRPASPPPPSAPDEVRSPSQAAVAEPTVPVPVASEAATAVEAAAPEPAGNAQDAPPPTTGVPTDAPEGGDEPEVVTGDEPELVTEDEPELETEDALHARAAAGDDSALERLAALFRGDPERAGDRCNILRALVKKHPERARYHASLLEAAVDAGDISLAETAAAIVSRFDPAVPEPATARDPSAPRSPIGPALRLLLDPLDRGVLALLSESVTSLQRRSLAQFGVTGSDRVNPQSPRSLARNSPIIRERLGREEMPLYARKEAKVPCAVLPTHPPCLLFSSEVEEDEHAVRYFLARGFATTAPDLCFVTGFDDEQGRAMMSAMFAAFGPPERVGEVSRDAAGVAAELWHVVPAKKQTALRDMLSKHEDRFDWDRLVEVVETIGARGALLSTCLADSLDVLERFDPDVISEGLGSEAAFEASVARSVQLRALLRAAMEDAHLEARPAQWVEEA